MAGMPEDSPGEAGGTCRSRQRERQASMAAKGDISSGVTVAMEEVVRLETASCTEQRRLVALT